MTTERVFPREAMTAERGPSTAMYHPGERWHVRIGSQARIELVDAEFAAAFRPASDLEDLILAAMSVARYSPDDMPRGPMDSLRAALRRWDGEQ